MRVPAPWLRLTIRQEGSASAAPHRFARVASCEARVVGAVHDALHAPPALDEFEAFAQKRPVVGSGLVVEQMDGREVAFAALRRRQSAEAADRDDARAQARAGERRDDEVEPGAMAADDDEIGRAHMRREQRDVDRGARRQMIGERIDAQEAVGLREAM